MDGDKVIIHTEGEKLTIEPVKKDGLLRLLVSLGQIDDEFPNVYDALPPLDDMQL